MSFGTKFVKTRSVNYIIFIWSKLNVLKLCLLIFFITNGVKFSFFFRFLDTECVEDVNNILLINFSSEHDVTGVNLLIIRLINWKIM